MTFLKSLDKRYAFFTFLSGVCLSSVSFSGMPVGGILLVWLSVLFTAIYLIVKSPSCQAKLVQAFLTLCFILGFFTTNYFFIDIYKNQGLTAVALLAWWLMFSLAKTAQYTKEQLSVQTVILLSILAGLVVGFFFYVLLFCCFFLVLIWLFRLLLTDVAKKEILYKFLTVTLMCVCVKLWHLHVFHQNRQLALQTVEIIQTFYKTHHRYPETEEITLPKPVKYVLLDAKPKLSHREHTDVYCWYDYHFKNNTWKKDCMD